VRAAERGREVGEEIRRDRRDDAEAERARQRVAGALRGRREVLRLEEDAPRPGHQPAARLGRQDATPVPLEEGNAQRPLERRELRRERRLRDVAERRRFPEGERVGDRDGVLELPQGEGTIIISCYQDGI
jgi:hypothetical protein